MRVFLLALTCLYAVLSHARGLTDTEWNVLIEAIAIVESSKNPNAVNGKHAGYLQISPCVVQDCNVIDKTVHFTNQDRYSIDKSIQMFRLYQQRYNPDGDLERAIRLWNGGPRYTRRSTDGYFKRVMRHYTKLRPDSVNVDQNIYDKTYNQDE